jgi:hypothetical protein
MVWEQYIYESNYNTETQLDSDEDHDHYDHPLHIDDWRDSYSDELEYMWMILKRYLGDAHLNNSIMDQACFDDFARFVHHHSSVQ